MGTLGVIVLIWIFFGLVKDAKFREIERETDHKKEMAYLKYLERQQEINMEYEQLKRQRAERLKKQVQEEHIRKFREKKSYLLKKTTTKVAKDCNGNTIAEQIEENYARES